MYECAWIIVVAVYCTKQSRARAYMSVYACVRVSVTVQVCVGMYKHVRMCSCVCVCVCVCRAIDYECVRFGKERQSQCREVDTSCG
jgi:hypothetical protein